MYTDAQNQENYQSQENQQNQIEEDSGCRHWEIRKIRLR